MTITLNGTTGITLPNGSASAPAATGSDTDTGIVYGTNTVQVATGGTTAVTVDSSQNVGIGTSSPANTLEVATGANGGINIKQTGSAQTGFLNFRAFDGSLNGRIAYDNSADTMKFYTVGTERMRIDSSGNLRFNSGYGSVATAYGCRAWASFNGGTSTILASGNISSITQSSAGYYTVIFATAMVDANYATFPQFQPTASNAGSDSFAISPLTTQVDIRHFEANTARSGGYCCVSIFR